MVVAPEDRRPMPTDHCSCPIPVFRSIAVVIQRGGSVPGHDYILTSFAAVALE